MLDQIILTAFAQTYNYPNTYVGAPTNNSGKPIVPCDGFDTCNWQAFMTLLGNIFNFLVAIALPLGTLVIVAAGIMYVMFPNNPGRRKLAKDALISAVIGLVIVLGAYIIVKTIVNFLIVPGSIPNLPF